MKTIKQNNNIIRTIKAILELHKKLESKILYVMYSPSTIAIKKLPISKIEKLVPIIPV